MKYKYTGCINIITVVINGKPYTIDLPKVDYSFLILFDLVQGEDGFFIKRDQAAQMSRSCDVKL